MLSCKSGSCCDPCSLVWTGLVVMAVLEDRAVSSFLFFAHLFGWIPRFDLVVWNNAEGEMELSGASPDRHGNRLQLLPSVYFPRGPFDHWDPVEELWMSSDCWMTTRLSAFQTFRFAFCVWKAMKSATLALGSSACTLYIWLPFSSFKVLLLASKQLPDRLVGFLYFRTQEKHHQEPPALSFSIWMH